MFLRMYLQVVFDRRHAPGAQSWLVYLISPIAGATSFPHRLMFFRENILEHENPFACCQRPSHVLYNARWAVSGRVLCRGFMVCINSGVTQLPD